MIADRPKLAQKMGDIPLRVYNTSQIWSNVN